MPDPGDRVHRVDPSGYTRARERHSCAGRRPTPVAGRPGSIRHLIRPNTTFLSSPNHGSRRSRRSVPGRPRGTPPWSSSFPDGRCGWLDDRFGVSWQMVPANMGELMGRDSKRVMETLFAMHDEREAFRGRRTSRTRSYAIASRHPPRAEGPVCRLGVRRETLEASGTNVQLPPQSGRRTPRRAGFVPGADPTVERDGCVARDRRRNAVRERPTSIGNRVREPLRSGVGVAVLLGRPIVRLEDGRPGSDIPSDWGRYDRVQADKNPARWAAARLPAPLHPVVTGPVTSMLFGSEWSFAPSQAAATDSPDHRSRTPSASRLQDPWRSLGYGGLPVETPESGQLSTASRTLLEIQALSSGCGSSPSPS